MEEIWKDVPGYEGLYQVSNIGRVKSLRFNKTKIMSQWNHNGYRIFNGSEAPSYASKSAKSKNNF